MNGIQLNKDKSIGVLKISGLLDIDSADRVRAAVLDCLDPRDGQGTFKRVDLGEVESCDVSGLQILLAAKKNAIALGNPLQFEPVSPSVADLATALGLSIGDAHAA